MHPIPTLVSHALCPYVQRVAIVMAEKALPFERIDIDLAAKPQWMLDISPTGKTPMLLTGGEALFESAAICEYLDDTAAPRLHPHDPLLRARHRAWMPIPLFRGARRTCCAAARTSAPRRRAYWNWATAASRCLPCPIP